MAQRWRSWKRHGGVVTTVIAIGLAACAIIAGPPQELVAKNDHAALAAWYDKEAAHLRQHAKDMMVMAAEYERSPGRVRAA